MLQTPWNMLQIEQCEKETGQAMLSDEHTLVLYSIDFGKLSQTSPSAVCKPSSLEALQSVLHFANNHHLPVTIRGSGLSQGGQAQAVHGSIIVHMEKFKSIVEKNENSIWVEANTSWSQLLEITLQSQQIPHVLPYNCNLTVGGVLSAGGVGASSFKFGPIVSHVTALEVILPSGKKEIINQDSPLFHACLGGQGRFAVITKANIQLRPCLTRVCTFFLLYENKAHWEHDLHLLQAKADFIETFCTPAVLGAKLSAGKRKPFAQWLYVIHASMEYENKAPDLVDFSPGIKPWKVVHRQDEPMQSYLLRHNSRFEAMQLSGQWELFHPWYECFTSPALFNKTLENLLDALPLHYAPVLQIVPVQQSKQTGFFMLPQEKEVIAVMILNPGVNQALLPSCLATIEQLDTLFLAEGGKRYLSGFLGKNLTQNYWKNHFGAHYEQWQNLKNSFDEKHIFVSLLHI